MKVLLFLFASFFLNPSSESPYEVESLLGKCNVEAEIENVIIEYNDNCDAFTWKVIVCNNSPICNSWAGSVNVLIEYCPFQGTVCNFNFPTLQPQTCTTISGTLDGTCSTSCIRTRINDSSQEEIIFCENC